MFANVILIIFENLQINFGHVSEEITRKKYENSYARKLPFMHLSTEPKQLELELKFNLDFFLHDAKN